MAEYVFKFPKPKFGKFAAQSITVKEMTAEDEELALKIAEAKGKKDEAIGMEMIRASISRVDGKPVPVGFPEFDKWNAKSRNFAAEAWRAVNGSTDEEKASFLESAEEAESPVGATVVELSSASG